MALSLGAFLLIGIPKEVTDGERRVAAVPQTIQKLQKLGFEVQVQTGAGLQAHFGDDQYESAGAKVVGQDVVWTESQVILKINAPSSEEISKLKSGQTLVCMVWPGHNKDLVDQLAKQGITLIAMDCIPRISRAQKMDVLSSMANIAGYRAVIEASNHFGSFFTGQITAAGKVPPAKVLVIGAGVAGLSAIGTAKGLGAIVRAFDTRPSVKDQVKSMGAEFLELDFEEDGEGAGGYAKVMSKEFIEAEMKLFAEQAKDVDIIVTTALIPGKPAPKLITREMVKSMREGSVIVDLAAEQGGNCELTEHTQVVEKEGVTIIGYSDLPSRLPTQASVLFANNLVHLLSDMTAKGSEPFKVNMDDEVVRSAVVVHNGEITWPPPAIDHPAPKPVKPPPAKLPKESSKTTQGGGVWTKVGLVVLALLAWSLKDAPQEFLQHMGVFVLACIIGWQVVWNVTPALHTPLMSVTNAISGIIVVGAMLQFGQDFGAATILAALAVLIATINISGGFFVTHRMLKMFRK